MGWLGWTEQQTLETSMQAIVTAHAGRMKMLRAIFGGDDAPMMPKAPVVPKMSLGKQIALAARRHLQMKGG